MALTGLVVVAVGVGGSFAFGVEENLDPDQAGAPGGAVDLMEEVVSVAGIEDALPAASQGSTSVELPVEVNVSNLKELEFAVEVRNSGALVGNLEWTFRVEAPDGQAFEAGRQAVLGPGAAGTTLTFPLDLAEANVTEPLGTWTVVVTGEVTGASAEDFPLSLTVDGVALVPAAE